MSRLQVARTCQEKEGEAMKKFCIKVHSEMVVEAEDGQEAIKKFWVDLNAKEYLLDNMEIEEVKP